MVELSALSAEILLPPVAEVIVTLPHSLGELNAIKPIIKLRRNIEVFMNAEESCIAMRAVFICAKESYLEAFLQQSG